MWIMRALARVRIAKLSCGRDRAIMINDARRAGVHALNVALSGKQSGRWTAAAACSMDFNYFSIVKDTKCTHPHNIATFEHIRRPCAGRAVSVSIGVRDQFGRQHQHRHAAAPEGGNCAAAFAGFNGNLHSQWIWPQYPIRNIFIWWLMWIINTHSRADLSALLISGLWYFTISTGYTPLLWSWRLLGEELAW